MWTKLQIFSLASISPAMPPFRFPLSHSQNRYMLFIRAYKLITACGGREKGPLLNGLHCTMAWVPDHSLRVQCSPHSPAEGNWKATLVKGDWPECLIRHHVNKAMIGIWPIMALLGHVAMDMGLSTLCNILLNIPWSFVPRRLISVGRTSFNPPPLSQSPFGSWLLIDSYHSSQQCFLWSSYTGTLSQGDCDSELVKDLLKHLLTI